EIFLDLTEQLAAARNRAGIAVARLARPHQPHFQHVGFDNGADIHAVALRHPRMRDAPYSILALPDLGKALVGLERIAAGCNTIPGIVEVLAGECRVGRGLAPLGIEVLRAKRLATGATEDVLG